MTLISWNGTGPILKNGAIGTEQACCCGPPEPCVVIVDGQSVDIATVDDELSLDVEWTHAGRTLQVPTGQQTFDYWYGLSTAPDETWHEQYTLGEESRQLQVWRLVAGFEPEVQSWEPPGACSQWTVTQPSAATCRIQGCVQTYYNLGTADSGVRPHESTDYQIRALWRWTCDIVSGVQQAVTYELIEGYRYEWDTTALSYLLVTGGDTGDEPVVTVTIAP